MGTNVFQSKLNTITVPTNNEEQSRRDVGSFVNGEVSKASPQRRCIHILGSLSSYRVYAGQSPLRPVVDPNTQISEQSLIPPASAAAQIQHNSTLRYTILSSRVRQAVALWTLHTWSQVHDLLISQLNAARASQAAAEAKLADVVLEVSAAKAAVKAVALECSTAHVSSRWLQTPLDKGLYWADVRQDGNRNARHFLKQVDAGLCT